MHGRYPVAVVIRRWWRRLREIRPVYLYVPLAAVVVVALLLGRGRRQYFPRAEILDAIRMVESGGRERPPDGDGGAAIGAYQIHRIYWRDAIAHTPALGGDYQDCRDRAYAERVIDSFMRRWVPQAWEEGHAETIARVHNGGPEGARKQATWAYWRRVRAQLEGS